MGTLPLQKVTGQNVVTDGGNSFGSSFGDVDNDGDLDFIVTNAFVNAQQVNFFYLNNGDGTFVRDTGIVSTEKGWSYGCAFGDYNDDGNLDLFVAKCLNETENNSLFKNNGGTNNWLKMDLAGVKSNNSAIGANVKLKADVFGKSFWQMRRVAGQNGYCGQTLQIHFGLGDASTADSIVIEWPSGIKQVLENQNVNQHLNIVEDTTLTSVIDEVGQLNKFGLQQNYPNPFNPSTNFEFQIADFGLVSLKVFDVLGREIQTLVNEEKSPGSYKVELNASSLASGIYFYELRAHNFSSIKKMILLK
jgi:hypothetical protein